MAAKSRAQRSQMLWGYVFIAPATLGLFIFVVLPVLASLGLSFTDWNGNNGFNFIGLDNFVRMLDDPVYLKALRTTALYSIVTVPVTIVLAIIVASLLNSKIKGKTFYRTVYFIPSVTMAVAVAVVWKWLYNSAHGLFNYLLSLVGFPGPSWLTDPNMILWSVMIIAIWAGIGHSMVILLAGLQGISESYYEAAVIDGATAWDKFIRITVPLLTPAIFFVTVTSFIGSFQVFDLVYIVTPSSSGGGGVLMDATRTAVYSIYQNGFQWFKIGYASAQAWLLFIVILVITIVQLRLQKKWVYYE